MTRNPELVDVAAQLSLAAMFFGLNF